MMGVRNQTCNHSENSERLYLHMRCLLLDVCFIQRDKAIVFLIHVDILNQSLSNEVREVFQPKH